MAEGEARYKRGNRLGGGADDHVLCFFIAVAWTSPDALIISPCCREHGEFYKPQEGTPETSVVALLSTLYVAGPSRRRTSTSDVDENAKAKLDYALAHVGMLGHAHRRCQRLHRGPPLPPLRTIDHLLKQAASLPAALRTRRRSASSSQHLEER